MAVIIGSFHRSFEGVTPMLSLTLSPPADFRFQATVMSHGWCVLAPFAYDVDAREVSRVHRLSGGRVVRLRLRAPVDTGPVDVEVEGVRELAPDERGEIEEAVARILAFDQRLDAFYALARTVPGYEWLPGSGAGRMLVSPTVWEDLAKTLLTTNTTWRMTKEMVARLVTLGEPYPGGGHAFPTPERVAALAPDALNAHVRAGYRGAYLHELARAIAGGELDPESWRDPAHTSDDIHRALRRLKGFGPYAAGAMMRLLGRFDELGLDSVCRTMFRDRHHGGLPATDAEIAAHYAPFGRWRGLAVWMDVMREDVET